MLKGKTAIITGSTSGIGLGIANMLAMQGCNIVINGFGDKDLIDAILVDLDSNGIETMYSMADMSNASDVKGMIKDCVDRFGSIDILVNNAGIQHVDKIEDFPDEKWEAILSINLSSNFYSIKVAIPYMRNQKWGRIINIASAHGLVASECKAAYVAAKHGVVGLTKTVALETAESNITCNAICPGWVLTPLVQKQIDAKAEEGNISFEQARINLLKEKQPSLEFVKPEDIGGAVTFLCSEAANQITGTEISIDGGWTAR